MNTLTYLAGKAPQPPPDDWTELYYPKFRDDLKAEAPPPPEAGIAEFVLWKEREARKELEAILKVQSLWAFTWARAMLFQSTSTLDEMFEQAFPTT